MLEIVLTLKDYQNFLLDAQVTIHNDHKNLLSNNSINNWVFCWKQLIEEYDPQLKYIKGSKNQEADALSRLEIQESTATEIFLNHPQSEVREQTNYC